MEWGRTLSRKSTNNHAKKGRVSSGSKLCSNIIMNESRKLVVVVVYSFLGRGGVGYFSLQLNTLICCLLITFIYSILFPHSHRLSYFDGVNFMRAVSVKEVREIARNYRTTLWLVPSLSLSSSLSLFVLPLCLSLCWHDPLQCDHVVTIYIAHQRRESADKCWKLTLCVCVRVCICVCVPVCVWAVETVSISQTQPTCKQRLQNVLIRDFKHATPSTHCHAPPPPYSPSHTRLPAKRLSKVLKVELCVFV